MYAFVRFCEVGRNPDFLREPVKRQAVFEGPSFGNKCLHALTACLCLNVGTTSGEFLSSEVARSVPSPRGFGGPGVTRLDAADDERGAVRHHVDVSNASYWDVNSTLIVWTLDLPLVKRDQ